MILFDTHTHLNFDDFDGDRHEVIAGCLEQEMGLIIVGTHEENSRRAVEIAGEYPDDPVFVAVGLHPGSIETHGEALDWIPELARSSDKVVAVGEIGLDYKMLPNSKQAKKAAKDKQKEVFSAQLQIATELKLPVIIHSRFAHKGILRILEHEETPMPPGGVAHGFTGTVEEARRYRRLGFYIGFNGIIFKQLRDIDFEAVIADTPPDSMLAETDCPFLSPPRLQPSGQYGGRSRNVPQNVRYVVERIANVKEIAYDEVASYTTKNAYSVFGDS